jgi:hypothetical protein
VHPFFDDDDVVVVVVVVVSVHVVNEFSFVILG